jgi:hypothetical protein
VALTIVFQSSAFYYGSENDGLRHDVPVGLAILRTLHLKFLAGAD